MTTRKQTQRLLQGAAFSAALLLVAAPAALADPAGLPSTNFEQAAPAVMNTPMPALSNAPKPDACFLVSSDGFANFSARQVSSNAPGLAAAAIGSNGSRQ